MYDGSSREREAVPPPPPQQQQQQTPVEQQQQPKGANAQPEVLAHIKSRFDGPIAPVLESEALRRGLITVDIDTFYERLSQVHFEVFGRLSREVPQDALQPALSAIVAEAVSRRVDGPDADPIAVALAERLDTHSLFYCTLDLAFLMMQVNQLRRLLGGGGSGGGHYSNYHHRQQRYNGGDGGHYGGGGGYHHRNHHNIGDRPYHGNNNNNYQQQQQQNGPNGEQHLLPAPSSADAPRPMDQPQGPDADMGGPIPPNAHNGNGGHYRNDSSHNGPNRYGANHFNNNGYYGGNGHGHGGMGMNRRYNNFNGHINHNHHNNGSGNSSYNNSGSQFNNYGPHHHEGGMRYGGGQHRGFGAPNGAPHPVEGASDGYGPRNGQQQFNNHYQQQQGGYSGSAAAGRQQSDAGNVVSTNDNSTSAASLLNAPVPPSDASPLERTPTTPGVPPPPPPAALQGRRPPPPPSQSLPSTPSTAHEEAFVSQNPYRSLQQHQQAPQPQQQPAAEGPTFEAFLEGIGQAHLADALRNGGFATADALMALPLAAFEQRLRVRVCSKSLRAALWDALHPDQAGAIAAAAPSPTAPLPPTPVSAAARAPADPKPSKGAATQSILKAFLASNDIRSGSDSASATGSASVPASPPAPPAEAAKAPHPARSHSSLLPTPNASTAGSPTSATAASPTAGAAGSDIRAILWLRAPLVTPFAAVQEAVGTMGRFFESGLVEGYTDGGTAWAYFKLAAYDKELQARKFLTTAAGERLIIADRTLFAAGHKDDGSVPSLPADVRQRLVRAHDQLTAAPHHYSHQHQHHGQHHHHGHAASGGPAMMGARPHPPANAAQPQTQQQAPASAAPADQPPREHHHAGPMPVRERRPPREPGSSSRILCRYFNTRAGCSKGDACPFRHEKMAPAAAAAPRQ